MRFIRYLVAFLAWGLVCMVEGSDIAYQYDKPVDMFARLALGERLEMLQAMSVKTIEGFVDLMRLMSFYPFYDPFYSERFCWGMGLEKFKILVGYTALLECPFLKLLIINNHCITMMDKGIQEEAKQFAQARGIMLTAIPAERDAVQVWERVYDRMEMFEAISDLDPSKTAFDEWSYASIDPVKVLLSKRNSNPLLFLRWKQVLFDRIEKLSMDSLLTIVCALKAQLIRGGFGRILGRAETRVCTGQHGADGATERSLAALFLCRNKERRYGLVHSGKRLLKRSNSHPGVKALILLAMVQMGSIDKENVKEMLSREILLYMPKNALSILYGRVVGFDLHDHLRELDEKGQGVPEYFVAFMMSTENLLVNGMPTRWPFLITSRRVLQSYGQGQLQLPGQFSLYVREGFDWSMTDLRSILFSLNATGEKIKIVDTGSMLVVRPRTWVMDNRLLFDLAAFFELLWISLALHHAPIAVIDRGYCKILTDDDAGMRIISEDHGRYMEYTGQSSDGMPVDLYHALVNGLTTQFLTVMSGIAALNGAEMLMHGNDLYINACKFLSDPRPILSAEAY